MIFALPTGVYAAEGPRGYDPELTRPETGVPFDFEGYSVLCKQRCRGHYASYTAHPVNSGTGDPAAVRPCDRNSGPVTCRRQDPLIDTKAG